MIDVLLITPGDVVEYLSNPHFVTTYDYTSNISPYPGELGSIRGQRILIVPIDPSTCSPTVLFFLLGASVIHGDSRLCMKYKAFLNRHKNEIEVNGFLESF